MSAWLYVILGAVVLAGAQAVVRQLRTPPACCSWCTRASGHQVTGHTDNHCRGPLLAQQQRADIDAAHQRDLDRKNTQLTEQNVRRQAERERHAARLRILQVGTIATRRTGRGNRIVLAGWIFDRTTGPGDAAVIHGTPQLITATGAPEKIHGWTLPELHAMVHGGACRCDVTDLAPAAAH
ncbi:hypothetical protein ACIBL8_21745 [Streptomyces sp. NPDC050523]|uniref:hypothetical protein n=1 Tax=Streptomyces sp. NPDC050523 TaxID=3365622 RepID=UPI0037A957A1